MPAESHSALDDSLETFAVKRGFGGLGRFHIGVGADLHAEESVRVGVTTKEGNFFCCSASARPSRRGRRMRA